MNRGPIRFAVLLLFVAAGALAFRLPRLELRPMHHDEANQAVKTGNLLDKGYYRYDPIEHHGPTLYYLTLPTLRIGGAPTFAASEEIHFRIVPVIFGVGLVLLLGLASDGLGRAGALFAGVLTAISPAMVYYSRYYIQETLLVFFTFAALVAAWRYTRTKSIGWALASGAAFGLMHATKETCVIAAAAMVAGLIVAVRWRRRVDGVPIAIRPFLKPIPLAGALVVCLGLSILFFSSFGTHADGPLDSVRTYWTYLNRAGGEAREEHVQSWDYYLKMLSYWRSGDGPVWSEGLIVGLAVLGFFAAFKRRGLGEADPSLARCLAVYTLVMTAVYCAIPYKTPWSMLGFLHGMILLAGYGVAAFLQGLRSPAVRGLVALGLVAAAGHLGWQAYRANYQMYADTANPYVYAHSAVEVKEFAEKIEGIAKVHPDVYNMVVLVVSRDTWPLPWYLRRFPQTGYFSAELPEDPDAPILVVDLAFANRLLEVQRDTYHWERFKLRPGVTLWLWVQQDLWKTYQGQKVGITPHSR